MSPTSFLRVMWQALCGVPYSSPAAAGPDPGQAGNPLRGLAAGRKSGLNRDQEHFSCTTCTPGTLLAGGDDPPRPPRSWGDPSPQTPLGGDPSPQTPLAHPPRPPLPPLSRPCRSRWTGGTTEETGWPRQVSPRPAGPASKVLA